MHGMSERSCAAHAGLSRGTSQKAGERGRLVRFANGSIDAAASDARRTEPCAIRAVAGRVAQMPHNQRGLAELHPHQGRHDGIVARNLNPEQRIGQRPAKQGIGHRAQQLIVAPASTPP